jgi:hypothetical protein
MSQQALPQSESENFLHIKDRKSALDAIVRLTGVTFLITLLLTLGLYSGPRLYLPVPVIAPLAHVPQLVNIALLIVNFAALFKLVQQPSNRLFAGIVLGCTAFWILQDILRFQPYIYMYATVILLCVFFPQSAIGALRIMVCGVYFWAGFHKLNATFIYTIFPRFIAAFIELPADNPALTPGYLVFLVVPIFECMIGIILFFTPWKKIGTAMAFAMLLVTLLCIGPFGLTWNVIVWPWNVQLFLLELVLFWGILPWEKVRMDGPAIACIALFVIAPSLALVDLWPCYPAFKLYSGNVPTAEIVLSEKENSGKLPFYMTQSLNSDHSFNLVRWTMGEFNTAPYPAPNAYRKGAEGLCPLLSDPAGAKLRIFDAPPYNSIQMRKTEYPLCP